MKRRRRGRHGDASTRSTVEVARRVVLDTLEQGVIMTTPDGEVLLLNEAARRLLGYTADELTEVLQAGRWESYHMDGRVMSRSEAPLRHTLATGEEVRDAIVVWPSKTGEMLTVRISTKPVRDNQGGLTGVVTAFSDLTEARGQRLEDELAAVSARVEEELLAHRADAEQQIAWQAFHDPLTGLPNRALLLDRLGHALDRCVRTAETAALLFIDLDRFKVVNDTMGHDAGDRLLVEVAERLEEAVRAHDTVARLGSDEFVVLADDLRGVAEVEAIATRILRSLSLPIQLPTGTIAITASIGIAFDVDHDANSLLRDADNALHRAKDKGKARYEIFDDVLRAETMRRVRTEQLLRRALDDEASGGVAVHYQPIIDLTTGALVSAEALLRLPGPDGRPGSPDDFVAIAEETGLIVALGAGVLDDACRQLVEWRDVLGPMAPRQVSVNVSPRQLAAAGFLDVVWRALDRHDLSPRDLAIEFTESAIISADAATATTIETLHSMGVSLAVDDFGTGYSSLAYLKRFPVDVVKLDRSFVDGLGIDVSDTEIVKAVISLGASLGLVTIAEGIETPEQLASLRALGCDCGQGFFLAPPAPGNEMVSTVGRLSRRPSRVLP